MPETIPQIRPSFNRSLRLETRPEWLSADTGALVQREMMDRSGLIDWLTERLHDPRHSSSIRYPLSDLLRTRLLLLGQGWRDQSDADRLRQDPSLRVASRARRGTAALEEGHGLASQPTLSRLLDTLSQKENLPVLHQAVTELACRRIEMIEGRRRKRGKKTMYLDVDGLPVEVHGSPGKRMERILSPADVPRVGGELCRDGGPDRRGDFSGSQLPGEEGAEVDATGGGPLSRACVRLDDRADGCGVPGTRAAEGAGVGRGALLSLESARMRS